MIRSLRSFINKYNLQPDSDAPPVTITATLSGDKRGDRAKELQTVAREYKPKWEEFCRFSWLVGDVRSACIACDEVRPQKAMPADPATMCAFIQYKVNDADDAVLLPNGQPIFYKNGENKGQKVVGVSEWSHPISLRKFRVAMRMCHRPYDNCRNEYQNSCDDCVRVSEYEPDGTRRPIDFTTFDPTRTYRACIRCGVPRILPQGDPTTSNEFQSTFNSRETHCENEHVIKGCLALSVKQVRTMRTFFLTDGADKFRNLQLWTIMLIAIRCFLRCDEVANIHLSDFATRAFAVNKEHKRVEHLAVWIRGKGDKSYSLLSLWRDDETPEFCPIRALLIYLAAANLNDGYLFPNYSDLEKHHLDAAAAPVSFRRPVSYNYIRKELKKAIAACFSGDPHAFPENECKVGTHTMRKTAYLFAVFAVLSKYDTQGRAVTRADSSLRIQPLELDDIEKAARHGTHQNSSIYFAANSNKYERLGPSNSAQWPHHRVSPWRSIYYGSSKTKTSYESNEDLTTRTDVPVWRLAHWFVREELGIGVVGWDPLQAMTISCSLIEKSSTAMEQFSNLLMAHLPTALYRQAKALFQQCCREVERQHDAEREQGKEKDESGKRKRAANNTDTDKRKAPPPPKRECAAEMEELQQFKKDKKGNKRMVYEKIKQFAQLPREHTTKKARTWLTKLSQTAKCVEYCVANCHNGDWASWEKSMKGEVPIGGYQKWKCAACNAKMDEIKESATAAENY